MCFQLDAQSLHVNLVRPMYPHHQQKYSSSLSLFSWQKLAADAMEVFHVYIHDPEEKQGSKHGVLQALMGEQEALCCDAVER